MVGKKKSGYKRLAAAKLTKKITDSLLIKDPYAKIIIMGDLNDNPTNNSLKKGLQSKGKTIRLGLSSIYNPFENLFRQGLGTTAYRDTWSLFDQILISKSLVDKNYKGFQFYKAGIYNKSYIVTPDGRYKGYPLRSWGNSRFTNGFSDHFPVYIYLIKKLKTVSP